MHTMRTAGFVAILAMVFLATAPPVWAQNLGALQGVARDTSGGVLPGVTVETERTDGVETVRVAVTGGTGQYTIISLTPGTYNVTFTLPGFSTFVREGIELSSGFTASVNADMQVGGLEETVTVSGESPLVDVVSSRSQEVLSREVFDAMPLGKGFSALQVLTVGALGGLSNPTPGRDVGGVRGDSYSGALLIHGTSDGKLSIDGKPTSFKGTRMTLFHVNSASVDEVLIDIGGNTAETQYGGGSVRIITKDGGNNLSGSFSSEYAPPGAQTGNLDAELNARGVTVPNKLKQLYDINGSLGGPIRQDSLWFFTSHRIAESQEFLAGINFNLNQAEGRPALGSPTNRPFYDPDPNRQAYSQGFDRDNQVKITWQASARNKFNFQYINQRNCGCFFGMSTTRPPEATFPHYFDGPNGWGQHMIDGKWTFPATNRLLVEVQANLWIVNNDLPIPAGARPDDVAGWDRGTGHLYGQLFIPSWTGSNVGFVNTQGDKGDQGDTHQEVKVSYVTGAHAFKVGFQSIQQRYNEASVGPRYTESSPVGAKPIGLILRNRVPIGVAEAAFPNYYNLRMTDLGFFAQDAWTIDRMTLNVGVRYDYTTSYSPEFTSPGGYFLEAKTYASTSDWSNFHDITPRLGISYDLFGTGRTALKFSLGKNVLNEGMTRVFTHPAIANTSSGNRVWDDDGRNGGISGDFLPQCDFKNHYANGECGDLSTAATFGQPIATLGYTGDAKEGWGNRQYSWITSILVEHELTPRIGVSAGYYRTWFGNTVVTDNLNLAPADHDEFCFDVPADARLPGGGGNNLCGVFDITPAARLRATDRLRVLSDNTNVYNGIDLLMNASFDNGATIQGGFNTGETVRDSCLTAPDSVPQFCRNVIPWKGQHNFKFAGQYPLPWYGLVTSATFLNLPGVSQGARASVANDDISASLGRNLSACANPTGTCSSRANVGYFQTGSEFESRQTQMDFRVSADIPVGNYRIMPRLDVFNLFNANDPQGVSSTFGANWLNASGVLTPRFIKLGVDIRF
jgi:hypothetical protein